MNIYLFVFETGPSGDLKVKIGNHMDSQTKTCFLPHFIVPQNSIKKGAEQNFHHGFSVLGNLGCKGKFL